MRAIAQSIRYSKGFTLIELMVTLIIIAILGGIAYPSYINYVTATRRSDGISGIMRLASQLEKYNSTCGQYTDVITTGTPVSPTCSGLGLGGTGDLSPDQNYKMTITLTTDATTKAAIKYSISAAPQGVQANRDKECGTFTYDSTNVKGISGGTKAAAYCWKH